METAIALLKDTQQQQVEDQLNVCREVFPQLDWSYNDKEDWVEGVFKCVTKGVQRSMNAKITVGTREKIVAFFKIAGSSMFEFSGTNLNQVLICMRDQIELVISSLADAVEMFSTFTQGLTATVQESGEVKGKQQGFASVKWDFSHIDMRAGDNSLAAAFGKSAEPSRIEICNITFHADYKKYPGDVSFGCSH